MMSICLILKVQIWGDFCKKIFCVIEVERRNDNA